MQQPPNSPPILLGKLPVCVCFHPERLLHIFTDKFRGQITANCRAFNNGDRRDSFRCQGAVVGIRYRALSVHALAAQDVHGEGYGGAISMLGRDIRISDLHSRRVQCDRLRRLRMTLRKVA